MSKNEILKTGFVTLLSVAVVMTESTVVIASELTASTVSEGQVIEIGEEHQELPIIATTKLIEPADLNPKQAKINRSTWLFGGITAIIGGIWIFGRR
ncbi:MAG: hypothetical protein ACRDD4_08505 [Culicoidibacterales bacterium]